MGEESVEVFGRAGKRVDRRGQKPRIAVRAGAARVLTGDDKGAARRLTAALDGAAADLDGADGSMMGERERDAVAKNDQKPASFYPLARVPRVDLYVGHGRASFVDLSAGPFAWGPLVGGEGLRNVRDLPTSTSGSVVWTSASSRLSEASPRGGRIAAALHTELDAMREQRKRDDVVDPKDAGAMLRAELDVYSMFAAKHCGDDGASTRRVGLCEDLARRTREIETALEDGVGKEGSNRS